MLGRFLCVLALVGAGLVVQANDAAESVEGGEDTVRALGRGIGMDEKAAINDALVDAIRYAIGGYIEAETIVHNNEIVKDEILTHSNAYVTHYDVLGKRPLKGDLTEVRVMATIRKQPLILKLRDVLPTTTVDVSGSSKDLYAQIFTQDKRDADAEKLLKSTFDSFDPLADLMKVTVVNEKSPEVSPSKESEDEKILSYQLKFEIDPDRYFKVWMPRMDQILSQISLSPDKPFEFKREGSLVNVWRVEASKAYSEKDRAAYFAYDGMYFMDANLLGAEKFIWGEECDLNRDHVYNPVKRAMTEHGGPFASSWYDDNKLIRRWGTAPEMKAKGKFYAALVKRVNRKGCAGMLYELSDRTASVLSDWMKRYSGLPDERRTWTPGSENAHRTHYRISLRNASGEELASGECRAFNHDMSNIGCVCWGDDREASYNRRKPGVTIPYVIYMTPWVGCFAGECTTWVDVEVEKKDILDLATITVAPERK